MASRHTGTIQDARGMLRHGGRISHTSQASFRSASRNPSTPKPNPTVHSMTAPRRHPAMRSLEVGQSCVTLYVLLIHERLPGRVVPWTHAVFDPERPAVFKQDAPVHLAMSAAASHSADVCGVQRGHNVCKTEVDALKPPIERHRHLAFVTANLAALLGSNVCGHSDQSLLHPFAAQKPIGFGGSGTRRISKSRCHSHFSTPHCTWYE